MWHKGKDSDIQNKDFLNVNKDFFFLLNKERDRERRDLKGERLVE